jgi:hypothetical protein
MEKFKNGKELARDEDAGVLLAFIMLALVAIMAVAGVLLGLWKIDTIALVCLGAGVFLLFLAPMNVWVWLIVAALVALSLLLWFDVIGFSYSLSTHPMSGWS